MDSDSWANRLFTGSSRHDMYYEDDDDMDTDDDLRPEFMCPFCADEFDVVELFCHIDEEHAVEAKNGVCPVCAQKVETDLVGHITMQHGSLLKCKRRLRNGVSNLGFSASKRESWEGSFQSFVGGSQSLASSNAEPDPLLSSFMSNLPTLNEPVREKAISSVETSLIKEVSGPEPFERNVRRSPLSAKDQEERARRSEFVQGLLLSTFMDDSL